MHELAVCQALIDQVEKVAKSENASRVTGIYLEIGPLSGVESQLLEHAYPLAAHGTLAQDARLIIDTAAVRVRCTKCDLQTDVLPNRLICGACGDWHVKVISGDELLLKRVELEKADLVRAIA
jgi:hydrogenase nickel incorporation protein HypA/HybF